MSKIALAAALVACCTIGIAPAYAQFESPFDLFKGQRQAGNIVGKMAAIERLRQSGNLDEAIKLAEALVTETEPKKSLFGREPPDFSAGAPKLLLGRLLAEAGEFSRAADSYEAGLNEKKARNPMAGILGQAFKGNGVTFATREQVELASLYRKAGRKEEFQKLMQELADSIESEGDDDANMQGIVLEQLGAIHLEDGNLTEAEQYLSRSLAKFARFRRTILARPESVSNMGSFGALKGILGSIADLRSGMRQTMQMEGAGSVPGAEDLRRTLEGRDEIRSSGEGASAAIKLASVYSANGNAAKVHELFTSELPDIEKYFRRAADGVKANLNIDNSQALLGLEAAYFGFAGHLAKVGFFSDADAAYAMSVRLNTERTRDSLGSLLLTTAIGPALDIRKRYVGEWLAMTAANPTFNSKEIISGLAVSKGLQADYLRAIRNSAMTLPQKQKEMILARSNVGNRLTETMQNAYATSDKDEISRRAERDIAKLNKELGEGVELNRAMDAFRPAYKIELDSTGIGYGAITPSVLRARLPEGAAYIEFFKISSANSATVKGQDGVYFLVAMLPSSGRVVVRSLGSSRDIDALVGRYLSTMNAPNSTGKEPDVTRLKEVGSKLYAKLLGTIVKELGNDTVLVICPDGELNMLPFEALVMDSGHFLISKREVRYVSSSRDLLPLRTQTSGKMTAAIFANPDYDAKTGPIQPLAGQIMNAGERSRLRTASGRALRDTVFERLPETVVEASRVGVAIEKAFGGKVMTYLGIDATDTNLLSVQAPRFVHVATHGFFLETPPKTVYKDGNKSLRLLPNPDEFSGLILSGANEGLRSGNEAGIVLSTRIAEMNLTGTELVTLSACSTGVGAVQAGEGVFGLKRALKIAGADNSITSLWNVASDETATLMVNFYELLAEQKSPAVALRAAKLKLMATKQNPFYWAPFVLSGASSARQ